MIAFLTALSGIAWTVVYVEAVRIGFAQRTYALPVAALALDIAGPDVPGRIGRTAARPGRRSPPSPVPVAPGSGRAHAGWWAGPSQGRRCRGARPGRTAPGPGGPASSPA
jgi:hypothetical protein